MPNFDGGHYFFTGLFPIRLEPEQRKDGSFTVPSHLLREALASLPNFSEAAGQRRVSPFARSDTTHFVRFGVIDEPAFNGRVSADAIFGRGGDPAIAQPVDLLTRPWLVMAADFDVQDASDGARDRWAADLWELMQPELTEIFGYCCEFSTRDDLKSNHRRPFEPVRSGADFAAYLARGQIETTMSFNDYWIKPPPLPDFPISRMLNIIKYPALLFALVAAYLRWWPVHVASWSPRDWDWVGFLIVAGAALLGAIVGAGIDLLMISRRGARPFPRAPNSDLRSVLKGLYLQQRLVEFAISHQFSEPEQLHRAFGDFLGQVRPDDLNRPTQSRGVLKS
jgi:hypothetical protein